jgi:competence protein ComFB
MEDIVSAKMPAIMTQLEVCPCETCRYDILAFVLNKLPPKYVVTRKGTIYAKLSLLQSQFDVDVVSLLTQAAAMVKEKPRHDAED